jgi:hypothetical protein
MVHHTEYVETFSGLLGLGVSDEFTREHVIWAIEVWHTGLIR